MRVSSILIFLLYCGQDILFSQKAFPKKKEYYVSLLAESDSLIERKEYLKAEIGAYSANRYFSKTKKSELQHQAHAAYNYATVLKYLFKDSLAIVYYKSAQVLYHKLYPSGSVKEVNCLYFMSSFYFNAQHYEKSESFASSGLQLLTKLDSINTKEGIWLLKILGRLNGQKNQYQTAIDYYSKGLNIARNIYGENDVEYLQLLRKLSTMLLHMENPTLAIKANTELLQLEMKNLKKYDPEIAKTLHTMGDIERGEGHFDRALDFHFRALEILHDNPNKDSCKISMEIAYEYSAIGKIFINLNKIDSAEKYFILCDSIFVVCNSIKTPAYGFPSLNFGKLYNSKGQYIKALPYLFKALQLIEPRSKNSLTTGWVYSSLVDSYCGLQKYDSATHYIDKAIYNLENSQHTKRSTDYITKSKKAEIFYNWFLKTKDISLLNKSINSFQTAEQGIIHQLKSEKIDVQRKKIIEDASYIIGEYIKALSQTTFGIEKIEKIWELSESVHGYLLVSSLKDNQLKNNSNIFSNECSQDSSYSAQIFNKEIQQKKLIEVDKLKVFDPTIINLQKEITDLKLSQSKLRENFQLKLDSIQNKLNNPKVITISQLQTKLSKDQSIIEYFSTATDLYTILINNDTSIIFESKIDSGFSQHTLNMIQGLTSYHQGGKLSSKEYAQYISLYVNSSSKLYDILIAPLSRYLKKELIIIPHNLISNIPFDVLLSSRPTDLSNFNTYHYLIKKHSISYSFSGGLFYALQNEKNSKTKIDLLAMAPFSPSNKEWDYRKSEIALRDKLIPLIFSEDEISKVSSTLSGNKILFSARNASRNKFLENVSQSKIIHLATHSLANQSEGLFSYIAFAQDSSNLSEPNLLLAGTISNMNLTADMVVLSGCETGIGQFQRGEGVISLAYAFINAGAKSVISSLWKLNDKSTMNIMVKFYENLSQGMNKPNALRNAKLWYISQNPGQASHPFFWSAFSCIGNVESIKN